MMLKLLETASITDFISQNKELVIILGVLGVLFIVVVILLTILIKGSVDRKNNKKNLPNINLAATNPPVQETAKEDKQGPLVVKIDTTQVNGMINNFLEKLADDLVEEEMQQKALQLQNQTAQKLPEPEIRYVEVPAKETKPEVVLGKEVEDEVEVLEEKTEIVEEEPVVEPKVEKPAPAKVVEPEPEPEVEEEEEVEEIEEEEEPVVEEKPLKTVGEEFYVSPELVAKVEIVKEKTLIYPEPKEIAKYATDTYKDEIEIRYGKDEENYKIFRKKKLIFIIQRTTGDYRITFQRKPLSAIKLLNKYPAAVKKASSPEGEQWYKITNKGQIEEADILATVDSSVKYMQDLEAKAIAKKIAAKEKAKAKKAKAKAAIKEKEKAKKAAVKAKVQAMYQAKSQAKDSKIEAEKEQAQIALAAQKAKEAEEKKAKAANDKAKLAAKTEELKAKEKAKTAKEKEKAKEKAAQEKAKAKAKEKAALQKEKEKEKAKAKLQAYKAKEKEKAALQKAKEKEKAKAKLQAYKAKNKNKKAN